MATRGAAASLRTAWLLAAALAIVAGLLGMHVLTSGHGSHGTAAYGTAAYGTAAYGAAAHGTGANALAGHTAVAHSAVGGHAGGNAAGHAGHAAASTPAAPDLASGMAPATCGGSCPGAQESGAPCVPSTPTGPAKVVSPPATVAVLPAMPADRDHRPAYRYLPPGPTPCDLSISRT